MAGKKRTVRRDVAAEVTATFIAQVEKAIANGEAPVWRNPWVAGGRPVSMSTRKAYRGINVLLLAIAAMEGGYMAPWWGTYRQIKALGGQVRKGEKGTQVVLYKTWVKTERDEATGELVERRIPTLRTFSVFNAEQADGLPERFYAKTGAEVTMPEPQAVLDGYLAGKGAPEFFQDVLGQAYFVPALNEVHVPPMKGHRTPDLYWSTVFHEVGHAADYGLRREADEAEHGRAKSTYAFGELVAEMTAGIVGAETGVEIDGDNSVAYLRGWVRALSDDPRMLTRAAAAAQRTADVILGVAELDEDGDDEGDAGEPAALAA